MHSKSKDHGRLDAVPRLFPTPYDYNLALLVFGSTSWLFDGEFAQVKDTDFKNINIQFSSEGSTWEHKSKGEAIGDYGYRPDRSFTDKDGKVVCIIESSSTGDRKCNLGELCQAHLFFLEEKVEGVLILSLCGKGKTASTPETLKEYLKPYFERLTKNSNNKGLKTLYLICESDFKNSQWNVFSSDFEEKAQKLPSK